MKIKSIRKFFISGKADELIKPTNKKNVSIFEQVAPDLKTNENCFATYKVYKKNSTKKIHKKILGCNLGGER